MNTFWGFEQDFLEKFVAEEKIPDLTKIFDEQDKEAISKNLKYGNLVYFTNSIVFTPNKENAKVAELNIVLNKKWPSEIIEEIFSGIQLPVTIAIGNISRLKNFQHLLFTKNYPYFQIFGVLGCQVLVGL